MPATPAKVTPVSRLFGKHQRRRHGGRLSCLDLGLTVHPEQPSLCRFFNICCYQGNLDYVERLFSKNVSLTANPGRRLSRDFNFRTALHAAVIGGQKEVVSFLLKHCADPRLKREIRLGAGVIKCLTPVGTVVEEVPLLGEAPLWNWIKSLAVCELLVEAGAAEEDGVMLLDAAIKEGNGDMVRRLLRCGLNPSPSLQSSGDHQEPCREQCRLLGHWFTAGTRHQQGQCCAS